MVRVMRERNFVAGNNSDKVLRETREGRFDNQSKHTSIELVDDGATTVLNFLLYQSLVWGGVRLQFAEESFGFHCERGVRSRGRYVRGWLGGGENCLSSPLSDTAEASRGRTREWN